MATVVPLVIPAPTAAPPAPATAAPVPPAIPPTPVPTPMPVPTVAPAPAVVAVRQAPAAVILPRTSTPVRAALPVSAPPPAPPAQPASPSDRLLGPGVDALVSPMAAYDCNGYSPPLPEDRIVTDPCAQPVTGVPLIVGHNHTNLLWNASTGWSNGTVVHYGGHSWRIVQTRVVDHYITYYPMPPAGAGLQIRTCQPDGMHEWVWDLVRTG